MFHKLMKDLRRDVSATLFYTRNDPNDRRLGDVVRSKFQDYEAANIVILGCPQDEGVRRNGGRPGARHAPVAIREQLYRLVVVGLEPLNLFDLGDTLVEGSLEEIHERQQAIVRQVIRDDKRLIVLGGGNDISYPDASALALEQPDLAAFNLDAHFDVRADSPRNSGTPYRQLLEQGYLKPERFFEVAYQPHANSSVYFEYLSSLGIRCVSRLDVQAQSMYSLLKPLLKIQANILFWGLDMDVVRASDAPGVSAPNPTGLDALDLIQFAALAGGDARSRLFEVSEVNPEFDLDNRTSRLAAVIIWHFLQAFQGGEKK